MKTKIKISNKFSKFNNRPQLKKKRKLKNQRKKVEDFSGCLKRKHECDSK